MTCLSSGANGVAAWAPRYIDHLALWKAEHEVFAKYRPLAIRTHLSLRLLGGSNKAISKALIRHCRHDDYLTALAAGGPRYSLDGSECGEVTAKQQERARGQLRDRRAKAQQERRAKAQLASTASAEPEGRPETRIAAKGSAEMVQGAIAAMPRPTLHLKRRAAS